MADNTSILEAYPTIVTASKEIWYDNGMINRQEPLEEKLALLGTWLSTQDAGLLLSTERELKSLTVEDLGTVCCGDESEAHGMVSPEVHTLLGQIFDEEYLT